MYLVILLEMTSEICKGNGYVALSYILILVS
ncbi:hypothetical protein WE1_00510 [Escherichia coli KTE17]|nr:hypothetical protein WE1_00510 [Escherichia coli KTE17]